MEQEHDNNFNCQTCKHCDEPVTMDNRCGKCIWRHENGWEAEDDDS